jgi:trk system potassium uptake protein TrkA
MSRRRFAVLGLGQFGRSLAVELCDLGCEVLAVDRSPKMVDLVRDRVTRAVVADIRDPEALKELFSTPFQAVVIAMGESLEASIMASFHLQELGVKEIWAEANSRDRAAVLKKVGASRIVTPERDMGRRIAASLANPNLLEHLPLTEGHSVIDVEAPSWMTGKTLVELDLRRTMHLAVIAIKAKEREALVAPGGTARIEFGDVLTLVGKDEDLARFHERK